MTAATKAPKTTATKKAAPAARKTSPARTTKAAAKPAAKKPVAKKAVTKTTVAKKAPAAKKTTAKTVVAKKAPAAKKATARKPIATTRTVTVPRQRTKAVAAVAPVPPVAPVVVPAPARRTPRPLIAKARRRADGRALSYSERLEEAMHRQLKHAGPVCHQCRMNAARLAALVPTGGRIAV